MIPTLFDGLALLCLSAPAHSDTPPNPKTDAQAMLFHQVHLESALSRSVTSADPDTPRSPGAPSAPSARPAAIPK
jgi:hypothetical protein